TNATLFLKNVQPEASGEYSVVVSNDGSFAVSRYVILTVFVVPQNDNFAARTLLTGTQTHGEISAVGATREAGEPNHDSSPGGASVWWTWRALVTAPVAIDTIGSTFDTLLAIYTGSAIT